jgi:DNA invertase Pin-like site-specific DNA recombinase
MTRPAAIYFNDKGRRRVERERAHCEALAASLGWTVVEIYEAGVSTFSGHRPQYERMLADLTAGSGKYCRIGSGIEPVHLPFRRGTALAGDPG